jgi:hypothetical protein
LLLVQLHKETNVLGRTIPVSIAVLAAASSSVTRAPAAPAEFFVVCASQPTLPTVYFSGILYGPASAFPSFRSGFIEYLAQHYAYKGPVGCAPAANAQIAQNAIKAQSTALRNAKKNVVDTGWTQSALPPALSSAAPAAVQKAQTAAPATGAGAAGTANGSTGGSSQLATLLGAVFGGGSGTGNGVGGCTSGQPAGAAGGVKPPGAAAGASGCQNSLAQVSSALTSAFAAQAGHDAGLGSAQGDSTKLVVYGCGRQDTQVACVTELTNQNQKNTLVQSSEVWKDTFIVDDRGDRHQRTSGFFLNIDGDQRPQLDISYGKTARFILMFDGVQTKVQKVALRSATGSLDVEDISLIAAGAAGGAAK